MDKGQRVRVNARIAPGLGQVPKPGDTGTVQEQKVDGTLLVLLDDGRRALLASWEVDKLVPEDRPTSDACYDEEDNSNPDFDSDPDDGGD